MELLIVAVNILPLIIIFPFYFYNFYLFAVLIFLLTICSIRDVKFDFKIIEIIIVIAIIGNLFIDFYYNENKYFYNNLWGRYRLLMGYFHPKYIGQLVGLLVLFQSLNSRKKYITSTFSLFYRLKKLPSH